MENNIETSRALATRIYDLDSEAVSYTHLTLPTKLEV